MDKDEKKGPEDPFGPVAEAAVQLHELKKTLVESGFSDAEAMQIILQVINS